MAKQSFKFFTPRDKPKKRRGVHTKSLNKGSMLTTQDTGIVAAAFILLLIHLTAPNTVNPTTRET